MAALLIYASPKRWRNTQHTLITKTVLPHVAEGYKLNIWLSSVLISLLKCVKRKQQRWNPQISILWDHTSEFGAYLCGIVSHCVSLCTTSAASASFLFGRFLPLVCVSFLWRVAVIRAADLNRFFNAHSRSILLLGASSLQPHWCFADSS